MFAAAHQQWEAKSSESWGDASEPLTAELIAESFAERPSLQEVRALERLAKSIVYRREAKRRDVITPVERERLKSLGGACAGLAMHVWAVLGEAGNPLRVVEWARSRRRAEQGRIPLLRLAEARALPESALLWVPRTLGFYGDSADRHHAFVRMREWLGSIAEVRPLPEHLVLELVSYAQERREADDRERAYDALMIAARRPPQVALIAPNRIDEELYRLRPHPSLATAREIEVLGLWARSGSELPEPRQQSLVPSLGGDGPSVTFQADKDNGSEGVAMLAAGMGLTEVVAFARLVIGGERELISELQAEGSAFLERAIREGGDQEQED
jgi:hypothetical protein